MNFLGGISTTGGTGTLTISQGLGLALPALALEDDEEVSYAIVERTSSTDRTIVQAESGVGTVSSVNVLTRVNPRVTWIASGPTYDQDSSVSALSFAASNVEIYIGPLAESTMGAMTQRGKVADTYGGGPSDWLTPANLYLTNATGSLASSILLCAPIKLELGFALSSLGLLVTTAESGKLASIAIASVKGDSGVPGRVLACANDLSLGSTGIVSASVTARILRPGWYYAMVNANSSTAAVRCAGGWLPNFFGAFGSGTLLDRTIRHFTRAKTTYGGFTLGGDAMSGSSGSATSVDNSPTPLIVMR